MTFFEEDLADGVVARVRALRVLDGVAGWLEVEVISLGEPMVWFYAPQWLALLTGEIARMA